MLPLPVAVKPVAPPVAVAVQVTPVSVAGQVSATVAPVAVLGPVLVDHDRVGDGRARHRAWSCRRSW